MSMSSLVDATHTTSLQYPASTVSSSRGSLMNVAPGVQGALATAVSPAAGTGGTGGEVRSTSAE